MKNRIFLAIFGIGVWILIFIVLGLVIPSFKLSIASILPVIIAFLILTYIYQFFSRLMKYRKNVGLKIYSDVINHFSDNKVELLISLALLLMILNRSFIPSNFILDTASLFINSLIIVETNLDAFVRFYLGFRIDFLPVITFITQFFFVFLIVRAGSSLFRKRKNKI